MLCSPGARLGFLQVELGLSAQPPASCVASGTSSSLEPELDQVYNGNNENECHVGLWMSGANLHEARSQNGQAEHHVGGGMHE